MNEKIKYLINLCKVELDPKTARKIADENGEISREDFFKFAVDTKLLDFGCVMGDSMSMGTLFQKPKKSTPVSPIGDNKQFHEVKSPSKTLYRNKEQKV